MARLSSPSVQQRMKNDGRCATQWLRLKPNSKGKDVSSICQYTKETEDFVAYLNESKLPKHPPKRTWSKTRQSASAMLAALVTTDKERRALCIAPFKDKAI